MVRVVRLRSTMTWIEKARLWTCGHDALAGRNGTIENTEVGLTAKNRSTITWIEKSYASSGD